MSAAAVPTFDQFKKQKQGGEVPAFADFKKQRPRTPDSVEATMRANIPQAFEKPDAQQSWSEALTPDSNTIGKYLSGLGQSVAGMAAGLMHPIDSARALSNAHADEIVKTAKSLKEGDYMGAAGHGMAAVLPGIGPMAANIGEYIGNTGDIAGGAGQATPLMVLSSPENVGKPALKAGKSVVRELTKPGTGKLAAGAALAAGGLGALASGNFGTAAALETPAALLIRRGLEQRRAPVVEATLPEAAVEAPAPVVAPPVAIPAKSKFFPTQVEGTPRLFPKPAPAPEPAPVVAEPAAPAPVAEPAPAPATITPFDRASLPPDTFEQTPAFAEGLRQMLSRKRTLTASQQAQLDALNAAAKTTVLDTAPKVQAAQALADELNQVSTPQITSKGVNLFDRPKPGMPKEARPLPHDDQYNAIVSTSDANMFARDAGLPEADAAKTLADRGVLVLDRKALMRGLESNFPGHQAMSDAALRKFGVQSTKELTDSQFAKWYDDVLVAQTEALDKKALKAQRATAKKGTK